MTRTGSPEPRSTGSLEWVNTVVATGSVFTALMFYAGAMYNSAYYSYFRLRSLSLGLSFTDIALKSLQLITMPVLMSMALAVILPEIPRLLVSSGVPARAIRHLRQAGGLLARRHPLIVLAGVCLMALWPYVQPYGWTAPLVVACGLLLGHTATAPAWRRGLAATVAGLMLVWAVGMAAGQQGRRAAESAEEQLVRRTAVVVLSTDRLSISGSPGPLVEDLGKGRHYRYRYSRLRLLVERDQRYYLLPLGWRHRTDPTYVIADDDSVRVELFPGTQSSH
ncbi:hypothetical protein [Streptomyces botrytidirepellens]|uniref:Uncharacterized protein n=1 Tax=Streptomyces botrytidirepellens TaxID=2486417 RepID=A0A3M8UD20_9ACTN|nr:hypothetical protein [Streptomyces botrytidirepellens]RNG03360.1 hypothetical protein EEJ42_34855 [Streptomyces botrytidirepellens]